MCWGIYRNFLLLFRIMQGKGPKNLEVLSLGMRILLWSTDPHCIIRLSFDKRATKCSPFNFTLEAVFLEVFFHRLPFRGNCVIAELKGEISSNWNSNNRINFLESLCRFKAKSIFWALSLLFVSGLSPLRAFVLAKPSCELLTLSPESAAVSCNAGRVWGRNPLCLGCRHTPKCDLFLRLSIALNIINIIL